MMDRKVSFLKPIPQLQQQLQVHAKKIMDDLGATAPAIEKIVYFLCTKTSAKF